MPSLSDFAPASLPDMTDQRAMELLMELRERCMERDEGRRAASWRWHLSYDPLMDGGFQVVLGHAEEKWVYHGSGPTIALAIGTLLRAALTERPELDE